MDCVNRSLATTAMFHRKPRRKKLLPLATKTYDHGCLRLYWRDLRIRWRLTAYHFYQWLTVAYDGLVGLSRQETKTFSVVPCKRRRLLHFTRMCKRTKIDPCSSILKQRLSEFCGHNNDNPKILN